MVVIMTNYEYVKENYPSRVLNNAIGGIMGCPEDYGLKKSLRKGKEYCKEDCVKCWQLQNK